MQQDKNAQVTHRESSHYVDCPICWAKFPIEVIGDHVDICAEAKEEFASILSQLLKTALMKKVFERSTL